MKNLMPRCNIIEDLRSIYYIQMFYTILHSQKQLKVKKSSVQQLLE